MCVVHHSLNVDYCGAFMGIGNGQFLVFVDHESTNDDVLKKELDMS